MARRYVFHDDDLPDPPTPWRWSFDPARPTILPIPPGGPEDWIRIPEPIVALETMLFEGAPIVEITCRGGIYHLRQWESRDTLALVLFQRFGADSFREAVAKEMAGLVQDIERREFDGGWLGISRSSQAFWKGAPPPADSPKPGPYSQEFDAVLKDVYEPMVKESLERSDPRRLGALMTGQDPGPITGEPGEIVRYQLSFGPAFGGGLERDEDVKRILALPAKNRVRLMFEMLDRFTSALPKK